MTTTDLPARDRLYAAEVATLYQNVVIGVLGATGAASALAVTLLRLDATTPIVGIGWALAVAGCAAIHIALRIAYSRAPARDEAWRFWGTCFTLVSLAEGVAWGWGSINLLTDRRFELELLVFVVCFGIAAGSVPAFGSFLPAFFAIFSGATLPELVWSLQQDQTSPLATAFLTLIVVFVFAMGGLGLRTNRNFTAMVRLQIQTDALAEDLRRQKEIAEQANRAKSTFLAAASHDLRQPVHALGLFVGALRGVPLPPEALRLVEQIEGSTLALDGLFSAILDLSRLDAGVVDVDRRPVAIQPLIDRVCRDYVGEAEAKGIAFRWRRSTERVLTDPALMERIIRNFVGNAIRYTAAGGVLVGCRRRGDRLRIEVWDTGVGIPGDRHEWIFQEYSQLENAERDRSKGLGLGLAIVRRLAVLLETPIALRSRPGQGSCFSVSIAMTTAAADPIESTSGNDLITTRRWLVLVIDDEKAIREAMDSLLSSWGHDVVAAGSAAEMLDQLATVPRKPDLVICDYRLRGEENGIEVIERLRSEYNDAIPALLITGDTAPERLTEAVSSGLLLLHKPVPNARLRAAMTHLVAAAETEAARAEAEEAEWGVGGDPVL